MEPHGDAPAGKKNLDKTFHFAVKRYIIFDIYIYKYTPLVGLSMCCEIITSFRPLRLMTCVHSLLLSGLVLQDYISESDLEKSVAETIIYKERSLLMENVPIELEALVPLKSFFLHKGKFSVP